MYDGGGGVKLPEYKVNKWHRFRLSFDCLTGRFTIKLNDGEFQKSAVFFDKHIHTLERLEFRTGMYRGQNSYKHNHLMVKDDGLPFADLATSGGTVLVDDVIIAPPRRLRRFQPQQ